MLTFAPPRHAGGRPRTKAHVSKNSPFYDCGACCLTLQDVIRLLPEQRIQSWADFRDHKLAPA